MIPRALRTFRVVLLGVAAWATSPLASAEPPGDFGLGIIIGDPTGASMKGFLSPEHAIDGAIGFGILGGDGFTAHADWLWHFEIQRWSSTQLDLHVGVGPKIAFGKGGRRGDGHFFAGARAPIGISLMFDAPFDVFLEAAATLFIVEEPKLGLDAAIGGRYWF